MVLKNINSKIDPVCGMNLNKFSDCPKFSYKARNFYFCGKFCKGRFQNNPEKFIKKPLVQLIDLWKIFKLGEVKIEVLKGLNLNIWPRDFIAIIGPSGSGKSTILNMIGLLDKPTSGKIFLKGKDISLLNNEKLAELRSKTFGFVFQQYNLIPWLTAYENTILPAIFAKKSIKRKKIELQFKEIGLKERMNHRPFELSGGEQQRVALLRALINNPEIILGDEPTGNLDSKTGDKILELLIRLNKIHKKTLIIVTHDADIAKKADQIITIKDGHLIRNHQIYKKIYTE